MSYVKVKVEDVPANSSDDIEPGYERIPYEMGRMGDWFVNTEHIDGKEGLRWFANVQAYEQDLRRLVKEKYDIRY